MPDSSSPLIVAVGASAGGVEALTALVAHLPENFPHVMLVALHMPENGTSALAQILDRSGLLPAVTAESGAALRPGVIHVARPGRHLLVDGGEALLSDGPTENGHRPSINALFRSVAVSAETRAVGVLLSGVGDDGVDGLAAIQARGGIAIAQHPNDAVYPTLPGHAIEEVGVDHVLPAARIGPMLMRMDQRPRPPSTSLDRERLEFENFIASSSRFERHPTADHLGTPSGYVCPDCGGALIAIDEKHNFRCHIGHAWTGHALLEAQSSKIDGALAVALRSLHERIHLANSLAVKSRPGPLQDRYNLHAKEALQAATVLSAALTQHPFEP
ncbi:chemotaxis protein CheB [Rhodococcoides yunnanense]|uniref:chemotaxis protein CheB n=1 Tax=Rhodococcoides yunnanense TaxID=278209 RepID=UPI000933B8D4|nr:chemotaxis protein CheB [Rhodococcus yunnanensis]